MQAAEPNTAAGAEMVDVGLVINGRETALRLDPRVTLLDALREHLHLTGTKKGNAGKLGKAKAHTARMLAGPEVQHYDQAVAVVVAETFEQARGAAKLSSTIPRKVRSALTPAANSWNA